MRLSLQTTKLISCGILACGIAACQSTTETVVGAAQQTQTSVQTAADQTGSGLGDALMTPLSDLNMTRTPIPEALTKYATAYDPLEDESCSAIAAEISVLREVLGPDTDEEIAEASRGEKVGGAVSDAALGAVSSTSRGLLPFSGLIRTASGASAYERRFNQAYKTGFERRAFLKGIGKNKGCQAPASPIVTEDS